MFELIGRVADFIDRTLSRYQLIGEGFSVLLFMVIYHHLSFEEALETRDGDVVETWFHFIALGFFMALVARTLIRSLIFLKDDDETLFQKEVAEKLKEAKKNYREAWMKWHNHSTPENAEAIRDAAGRASYLSRLAGIEATSYRDEIELLDTYYEDQ